MAEVGGAGGGREVGAAWGREREARGLGLGALFILGGGLSCSGGPLNRLTPQVYSSGR